MLHGARERGARGATRGARPHLPRLHPGQVAHPRTARRAQEAARTPVPVEGFPRRVPAAGKFGAAGGAPGAAASDRYGLLAKGAVTIRALCKMTEGRQWREALKMGVSLGVDAGLKLAATSTRRLDIRSAHGIIDARNRLSLE